MTPNDANKELIRDAKQFTALYEQLSGRLIAFAKAVTKSKTDAEDINADVFCKFWLILGQPNHQITNPEAYLYRMVRNACLDLLRQRKLISNIQADLLEHQEQSTEAEYVRSKIKDEVLDRWERMKKLSPEYRKVFVLTLQGHNDKEIAAQLGKTNGTVRKIKHRMKKLLKGGLASAPGLLVSYLCYCFFR